MVEWRWIFIEDKSHMKRKDGTITIKFVNSNVIITILGKRVDD